MKFLVLDTHDPYLNLAIEEYLFLNSEDEIFMLWQNAPTVVIGRNQNAYAEINRAYTDNENIKIARRITGGGAVYHDLGNVNYTFISSDGKEGIDFSYFTSPIIEALFSLGVRVTLSGRNDLVADGDRKISGNAQHRVGQRVLHHGTLLFDTDLDVLSSALNVDPEKIKSKAMKSARSRVVNISELMDKKITTDSFIRLVADYVINKYNPEIIETPSNEAINSIYRRNCSAEWIFPNRDYLSKYTVTKKKRYPFGIVECSLDMRGDNISDIKISGDFFGTRPIPELENLIRGTKIQGLKELIATISVSNYIFSMTSSELVELITD
ncbi:MAG: lipoate--protein ligase [Clostridia bacterium]|nr:lipoate--protein ligase [Clostridia bacterium]